MIEVLIDARNFGKYGSGFAVALIFQRYIWRRSFNCGKITGNQAELKAVEFSLKSIKPEFRTEPVIICSTGRYAQLVLEHTDGIWKRDIKANTDFVVEVRKIFLEFSDVKIETKDPAFRLNNIKILCEDAVRKEKLVNERI